MTYPYDTDFETNSEINEPSNDFQDELCEEISEDYYDEVENPYTEEVDYIPEDIDFDDSDEYLDSSENFSEEIPEDVENIEFSIEDTLTHEYVHEVEVSEEDLPDTIGEDLLDTSMQEIEDTNSDHSDSAVDTVEHAETDMSVSLTDLDGEIVDKNKKETDDDYRYILEDNSEKSSETTDHLGNEMGTAVNLDEKESFSLNHGTTGDATASKESNKIEVEKKLFEYYGKHNYSDTDYQTYSQDPEWRELMSVAYPDIKLPEKKEGKDVPTRFYDSVADYYKEHDYSPEDFDTYSQDPEWRNLMTKEFPDYKLPTLDDEKTALSDIVSWLPEINPRFDIDDLDSPWTTNCGSCAYAVFNRLNGNSTAVASEINIDYFYQMESLINQEFIPTAPENIEEYLLAKGDGAHAVIGVVREYGSGHWFNAICKDGKVYAVDGQIMKILDWPPDYGDVIQWKIGVETEKED